MRCIICTHLSFETICKKCRERFLVPKVEYEIKDGLQIIYFYRYDDIATLLKTKHTPIGYRVFHTLAKELFKKIKIPYTLLPIDYHIAHGYNHSAIIAKHAGKNVQYGALQATNKVSYSGKTLRFRKQNPRGFIYKGKGLQRAVLVDDIYTTATTLNEAKRVLAKHGVETVFAITLAH